MKKLLLGLALFISICAVAQQKCILGFTQESGLTQFRLEEKFDGMLKPQNLDQWMKRLSARPHHLGSPYDKANAEYIRDLFKEFGFDATLEVYQVLFPTPRVRLLELTGPSKYLAKLTEPALREDATSGQSSEQLPVYNAWSADGDVTGELVYVNYGVPDDYMELERLGIDVRGKIVIARYGGSWRGIKPKVAQEHGAVGCLIFSDPKDDGYYKGDVYPKGAYKNQFGAQRGSVMDLPVYPGDPLTPGVGATVNATRLDRSQALNLLKIPVLPISYGDAQPLLANLAGPVAPDNWRGALPITYHIGPGVARVHLKLQFEWKLVDCYNVIAKLTGSELPDEWVIRGNHHDAWVNGASDPVSGMVAELEEARVVGELVKTGWKPRRTLVYCAWDGEEQGLIGSTEWVEHHAAELQQRAVVYINTDGNGRGFFYADGSGTLQTMLGEIVGGIIDPETGKSVLDRARSLRAVNAATVKEKREILDSKSFTIGALGSGSDFSGFEHHIGIPSLSMGYGGEDGGGEYHSIYDSYDHFRRFKDPTYVYGVTLAKTCGRTTLRFANADILPLDFKGFQKTLDGYLKEVVSLIDNLREKTEVNNRLIREGSYAMTSDPREHSVPPTPKDPVPYLNFSSLQNAIAMLEKSTDQFSAWSSQNSKLPADSKALNKIIHQAEQKLLNDGGLPRRPWYKNTICAPGYYTGYSTKTFPGVREAIEQRNWTEAQEQIEITARAITEYSRAVESAVNLLPATGKP